MGNSLTQTAVEVSGCAVAYQRPGESKLGHDCLGPLSAVLLKRAESLKVEIRCDLVHFRKTAPVAEWHGSVFKGMCFDLVYTEKGHSPLLESCV